jgi:pre-rRNA-processing protein TSR3
MRSSAGSPNPPGERSIALFVERVGDDHPKACTGQRLLHLGLARAPPQGGRLAPRRVLLDPHSPRPLSPVDLPAAYRGGLLAIDCSWNRLGATGRFPVAPGSASVGAFRRRLPWLLAANPQHFGRLAELNTAEALAAGLYLLGETTRARQLIDPFPGGPGFFDVNARAMAEYVLARDPDEIREAERRLAR